jgi:hypothetical protein
VARRPAPRVDEARARTTLARSEGGPRGQTVVRSRRRRGVVPHGHRAAQRAAPSASKRRASRPRSCRNNGPGATDRDRPRAGSRHPVDPDGASCWRRRPTPLPGRGEDRRFHALARRRDEPRPLEDPWKQLPVRRPSPKPPAVPASPCTRGFDPPDRRDPALAPSTTAPRVLQGATRGRSETQRVARDPTATRGRAGAGIPRGTT